MNTQSTVEPKTILHPYINGAMNAIVAEFGKVDRTDWDRSGHQYGVLLRFMNNKEPRVTIDDVSRLLHPIRLAHPLVQIDVPQVTDSWIDITCAVTPPAFAQLIVANQITTKGAATFTNGERDGLTAFATAVGERFVDRDPSWADVAGAIANKCSAFAALLVPPTQPPQPTLASLLGAIGSYISQILTRTKS